VQRRADGQERRRHEQDAEGIYGRPDHNPHWVVF
jgi:hypothetical protein